jgi:oxygen-independent coproporphyrinogen III oxidase
MSIPDISPALLAKYDTAGPRYTSYPPVPDWTGGVDETTYRSALSTLGTDDLALYVHLPFCAARCLYCGCAATPTTRTDVVDTYLERLARELRMVTDSVARAPLLRELHWGGGTPNFLLDGQLVRAFDLIAEHFTLPDDLECSVEADPRLVTATQLRWLRGLGFKRISFGVQDLDPFVQQAIGRVQPTTLVFDVVDQARAQGFSSLNLDILYGLPYQTEQTFAATIDEVIALRPDRIACFGYAHVPWMRPHQRRMDEHALPDSALRFALYTMAVQRFTEAGYVWIGLDHFALPEDPLAVAAESGQLHRDFMGYTTRRSRNLLGVGVSAIGEIGDLMVQNMAHLGDWQRAVDADVLPVARGHHLTADDRLRGQAIRDLLCNGSVARSALPGDERLLDRFRTFEADGLVLMGPERISVTPTGRFFLRNVAMALDAYRQTPLGDGTPRFSRTV